MYFYSFCCPGFEIVCSGLCRLAQGGGICPCRERDGLVGLLMIERERNWERDQ